MMTEPLSLNFPFTPKLVKLERRKGLLDLIREWSSLARDDVVLPSSLFSLNVHPLSFG